MAYIGNGKQIKFTTDSLPTWDPSYEGKFAYTLDTKLIYYGDNIQWNQISDADSSGSFIAYVDGVSGALRLDIDINAGDIVDNSGTILSSSGYLQGQIDSNTTDILDNSGTILSNTTDIIDNSGNIISTSGHLQTQIDNIEVSGGGGGGGGSSNYSIALLNGLGQNMSGWYTLSVANLGETHPVDGVSGAAIVPSVSGIIDARLTVNGFTYYLDTWVDSASGTQPGVFGVTAASGGFSLDVIGPKILWNYDSDVYAGFDLDNADSIILRYQA